MGECCKELKLRGMKGNEGFKGRGGGSPFVLISDPSNP